MQTGNEEGFRVLCLVHGDPSSPLVEIRLRMPLEHWASIYGGYIRIISLYESRVADLSWADVVVFQRIASKYVSDLAHYLQQTGRKIVFEIDDLLTNLPSFLSHHLEYIEESLPHINNLLMTANAVSVSTEELAIRFRSKNKNIHITSNYSEAINISASHYAIPPTGIKLVVASSDRVLVDMLISPLFELQNKFDIQVIAIGPPGERLENSGIRIEKYSNFGHAEFKNFVASINNGIGLIPLDSSEFSSCKTAVKYFDYSVCGIPSICSNVLPYKNVVENGVTGILVENTAREWVRAIEQLIFSHELRTSLVNAAKKNVFMHHNLGVTARNWCNLFNSLDIQHARSITEISAVPSFKRNYLEVTKFATCHVLKLDSYIKLFRILSRYGVSGLYERIVRR